MGSLGYYILGPHRSLSRSQPRRSLTYLGFNINIGDGCFRLSQVMKEKPPRALNYASRAPGLAQKFWQRLGGLVNFVCTAFGLLGVMLRPRCLLQHRPLVGFTSRSRRWAGERPLSTLPLRAWRRRPLPQVAPAGRPNDFTSIKEVLVLTARPATISCDSQAAIANLSRQKKAACKSHFGTYLLLFLSLNWFLFGINWRYIRPCNNPADAMPLPLGAVSYAVNIPARLLCNGAPATNRSTLWSN